MYNDLHTSQMATLAPNARRRGSTRHRAGSHLDSHHSALNALRAFLRGRTCYDAFPISFRLIVLDTKLNVKKALQCLLLNSASQSFPFNFLCLINSFQASYLRPSGIATSQNLPACSPYWTSSISSSTTTRQPTRSITLPQMSNTFVLNHSEVSQARCFDRYILIHGRN